jgi:hypothetical protein
MDTALKDLLAALPRSRKRATSCLFLSCLLGITEREVRDQIKTLREDFHIPVMALPVRMGVWLSDDPDEVKKLIACQTSRARSIEKSIRSLERVLADMSYSGSLFDERVA